MPAVTELLIDMFTIEPVMGGTSVSEQREHIQALLVEPLTSSLTGPDDVLSKRRELTRRLHDPSLTDEARMRIVKQLRDLKKSAQKEQVADGSPTGS